MAWALITVANGTKGSSFFFIYLQIQHISPIIYMFIYLQTSVKTDTELWGCGRPVAEM